MTHRDTKRNWTQVAFYNIHEYGSNSYRPDLSLSVRKLWHPVTKMKSNLSNQLPFYPNLNKEDRIAQHLLFHPLIQIIFHLDVRDGFPCKCYTPYSFVDKNIKFKNLLLVTLQKINKFPARALLPLHLYLYLQAGAHRQQSNPK